MSARLFTVDGPTPTERAARRADARAAQGSLFADPVTAERPACPVCAGDHPADACPHGTADPLPGLTRDQLADAVAGLTYAERDQLDPGACRDIGTFSTDAGTVITVERLTSSRTHDTVRSTYAATGAVVYTSAVPVTTSDADAVEHARAWHQPRTMLDASRLTAEDWQRIDAATVEHFARLAAGMTNPTPATVARLVTDPTNQLAATRVAAHAIGCTLDDLRDSEITAIQSAIVSAARNAMRPR